MATEVQNQMDKDFAADVGWYGNNANLGARIDLIGDVLLKNDWAPAGRRGYTKGFDAADGVLNVYATLDDDARYLEARIGSANETLLFDADMRGMGPQSTKWLVQGFEAGIQERANVLSVAALQTETELATQKKIISSWTVAQAAQEASNDLLELESTQPHINDLTYYARRTALLETMQVQAQHSSAYAEVLAGLRPTLDLNVTLEAIKWHTTIEQTWNSMPHEMYPDEFSEMVEARPMFHDNAQGGELSQEGTGAFEVVDKRTGLNLGFSNAKTAERAIADVHEKLISDALFANGQDKPLQNGEPTPSMPRFEVIEKYYDLMEVYADLIESKYPEQVAQQRAEDMRKMSAKEDRKAAEFERIRQAEAAEMSSLPKEQAIQKARQDVGELDYFRETQGADFVDFALKRIHDKANLNPNYKNELETKLQPKLIAHLGEHQDLMELFTTSLNFRNSSEVSVQALSSDDHPKKIKAQDKSQPAMPRDLRQELTDKFVTALDQGKIPWAKPWDELKNGIARNMVSGRAYTGGNSLILTMTQIDQGYADPRFGTVKQINELGGRVKAGEKGAPIEVWKERPFWERKDISIQKHLGDEKVHVIGESQKGAETLAVIKTNDGTRMVRADSLYVTSERPASDGGVLKLNWEAAHKRLDSSVAKVHTVFNVEQCNGLQLSPLPEAKRNEIQPVQRVETIAAAMRADGLTFGIHQNHAYYSPRRDQVVTPPLHSFPSAEAHSSVMLHEIGHATGAEHRLNREGITGGHKFGSPGYAKEELRAEMFSAFMAAETGVKHDFGQHFAYVQSWSEVLKNDKNEIFRAASEASKALGYVLNKEHQHEIQKTQDHHLQHEQGAGHTTSQKAKGDHAVQAGVVTRQQSNPKSQER